MATLAAAIAAIANEPLANIRTFSGRNDRHACVHGLDGTADRFRVRTPIPRARFLFRASLPLQTVPAADGCEGGLGDCDVFVAGPLSQAPKPKVGRGRPVRHAALRRIQHAAGRRVTAGA